jgi:hypothetical protein
MTTHESKTLSDLLKFSEALWEELKDAGYADKDAKAPFQFKAARAILDRVSRPAATKRSINRAIAHLGVQIRRDAGYSYFTSLLTGDQIGDSVAICHLNQATVERWVREAEDACKQYRTECDSRGRLATALPQPEVFGIWS